MLSEFDTNETASQHLLSDQTDLEVEQDFDRAVSTRKPLSFAGFAVRSIVILLSVGAGILIGRFYSTISTTPVEALGINPRNPIPREVFDNRHDVPFIPYREFMGPSEEADANWEQITMGTYG
jgi:hypothetical protein